MRQVWNGSVLRLEGVTKSYDLGKGRRDVLRGVSIDIKAGEVVALIGPSGSGKTTLLSISGLLQNADAGRVFLAGVEVSHASPTQQVSLRRSSIGFLFQEATLASHLTALENVLLPLLADCYRADPARGRELLVTMGLADHADDLPAALSGGQAQRVALCRALIRSPRLLLADEPTASLDRTSADNVRAELRALASTGMGVMVVTHDPVTARMADRVLTLEDGLLQTGAVL